MTLIACDLDGTLTFRPARPAPVVRHALHLIHRQVGVRLIIATARSPRCVRAWFGELPALEMVCCNGALHIDPYGALSGSALPHGELATFLSRVRHAGSAFCLEYGEHSVVSAPGALPWMDHPARQVLTGPPDLDGVLKCTVDDAFVAMAAARDLTGISVVRHNTGEADAMAAGVSKGATIDRIRRDGEYLVAFGNDRNDAEMLAAADEAFVVGTGLSRLTDDRQASPHRRLRRLAADPGAVADALRATMRSCQDRSATGFAMA